MMVIDFSKGVAGKATLDNPVVSGRQYILGSISELALTLPTTGGYQDYIWLIFAPSASFTPTTSGGSVVGETIMAVTSGKTYEYLFTWNGSAWVLSIMEY